MKINSHFIGLGIVIFSAFAGELRAESMVMTEPMTEQQLIIARRQAVAQEPTKHLAVATGEVLTRPPSLLDESDVVCFGKCATLIPKRAILQIPKNLEGRIKMQPDVTLQSWSEFYAVNRAWITTIEVSQSQAEGKDPIAEPIKQQMIKSGNLIVATYLGGPISVLPNKAAIEKSATKAKL
jgi:hypothetical protein